MKKCIGLLFILVISNSLGSPSILNKKELREESLKQFVYQTKLQEFYSKEFSPENLYQALVFLDVQNPHIVFAQSQLETGFFKSQSFTKYNNLFGMKKPKYRDTYAVGKKLGHAEYKHWFDSVRDYKEWQDHFLSGNLCEDNYYKFLNRLPYAEAPNYVKIVRYMVKSYGVS